jgi:hypothetical protein
MIIRIINGLIAPYEHVSDFPKETDSRRPNCNERGVPIVRRSELIMKGNEEGGLLGHR